MARAKWAWRLLCVFPWVLKYLYCHQLINQTHPRGNRRVLEKVKFYFPSASTPRNAQQNRGGGHINTA